MKILGFDLASLFKAPKVTGEPEIPEPQEPMPVEYNEIDTSTACTEETQLGLSRGDRMSCKVSAQKQINVLLG